MESSTQAQRKVCIVTGTRAEYGLLKPVMQAIQARAELQLQVVVTGMHLDPAFGMSADLITKDGFNIDRKVSASPAGDSGLDAAMALGTAVTGISKALSEIAPDIVLVLGDRAEILAASIAAVYQNIPLAHIHGGDKSRGGLDESARHAITKMAHVHFPATEASAGASCKWESWNSTST